ncbi:MAG: ribonuclease III domain-containing protein [Bacillota bacterium]|nr:ribonuclease III domain-containing protein [Bacillota bacterium]
MLNIEEFNIFRSINTDLNEEDVKMMNPLSLAFVGDGVFEMFIRTQVLGKGRKNSNKLHIESSKLANNKAQAEFLARIKDLLTNEEKAVVKRGINSKNHTIPKNANVHEYKLATGLEALFGYHYLLGNDQRILELYKRGTK